jgi:hypothetical protein
MISDIQETFRKYCGDLSVICTNGRTYLKLYKNTYDHFQQDQELYNMSPTIFAFIRDGLLESAVSNLLRLYDTHPDALSIYEFLNYIDKKQTYLYSQENINTIQPAKSKRDNIENIEGNLLKKLKTWRDKRLFHLQKDFAGDLYKVFRENKIEICDLERLYDVAKDVINYYAYAFGIDSRCID